jgi:hypothetical protein
MTYTYEKAGFQNPISLDEHGRTVASSAGSRALLALQDIPLAKLQSLWIDFQTELRIAIRDVMAQTPEQFSNWHVHNGNYDLDQSVIAAGCCIGFKRSTAGAPKLHYLRQSPLIQALIDRKLIPATDAHGRPRRNMVRGEGGAPAFCQALPIEQQRLVLAEIFAADQASLDDILFISQSAILNLEAVDKMLKEALDVAAFLRSLAEALWNFDTQQKTGGKPRVNGGGRHYAAPWFCMWLAREGYVLLPRLQDSEYLLPRMLTPFFWTFFVPQSARELAAHLVRHVGNDQWAYAYPAFRDLLLTTNFFQQPPSTITMAPLLRLKEEYTTSENVADSDRTRSPVARSHGLNKLCDAYLAFHGKTWENIGPDARYFGGGRKITSDRGREAFDWVERPTGRKLTLYRKHLEEIPNEFPDIIQEWARDLRRILPLFSVQDPEQKVVSLNHWLLYLIKLGDKAPRSWLEIDRETHINHSGQGTHLTFVEFLKTTGRGNRQKIISDMQQAWYLAATRDGFRSKATCPIDFKMDHVGWGGEETSVGRTRRKSVPQAVHHILVEENRRDGFAFARDLIIDDGPRKGVRIHWRSVFDPKTQKHVELFWPGVPMILDVILATGMRSSSAKWLDSGEGDEYWLDPNSLEVSRNPLPSRTKNRAASFLRLHQIGPKEQDKVLGMHLAVNKTGPHSVPWVDLDTARYFQEIREWQLKYNPRRSAIKASRSEIQVMYAGEGMIPEVYPVFRDPESRTSHPPTTPTIYSYWEALLRHCEPIVEKTLGYYEPLIVNGKPRWDLHSLRVTTISTLLEAGIEPWIVAELAGHTSVQMTWHYKDIDPRKTHLALRRAHEQRRERTLEALEDLQTGFSGSEDEFQTRLQELLGGVVRFREDNAGMEILRPSFAEGIAPEVFSHGVCPGGDCNTGGPEYKNAHQRVFRPRACSRCRFRLTGPMFLAGLVHRMNSLMVEIKGSMEKEAGLNLQIEKLEDQGAGRGKVLVLRGLITRERELRDELWAEWCAELATIRKAEALQDRGNGDGQALISGLNLQELRLQVDTVHQLELIHSVLQEGNLILGATLEVPPNLQERRDAVLLEVARNNELPFYHLAPERRRRALDRFGDLLLDHVRDADSLQRLIDGEVKVAEMPSLDVHVQELVASETSTGIAADRAQIDVAFLR